MRMHVDGKTEIGGEIAADFAPLSAGIISAQNVPMLLHKENVGTRRVQRNTMHAVANFGIRMAGSTNNSTGS